MINWLLSFSLRNRALIVILSIICMVLGPLRAQDLPVDVFPDLSAPRVTIVTEVTGLASEEVESLVTYPVESAVFGLPGVRRLRSASAPGISLVWVEFDWDTHAATARQRVTERVQSLAGRLPPGVEAPILAPDSSVMGEIAFLAMTSEKVDAMTLRRAADVQVRRRLLGVQGVSQVVNLGGEVRQYQVRVDPLALASLDLSLSDLREALLRGGHNAPGGYLVDRGQESVIRVLARPRDVADLEKTLVKRGKNRMIFLRDVATVEIAPAVSRGLASFNAKPAVILSVVKQPQADTVGTTARMDAVVKELQATLKRQGIELHGEVFRQQDFIDRAIANLVEVLRDGAVLVVVVIAVFLWSFRPMMISVLAIPLSMSVAAIAMSLLGLRIDTMTLGGLAIAIGEVVDDAIVDVENVLRRLKEQAASGLTPKKVLKTVYEASVEVRSSVVSATVILILVFLPLMTLEGMEGRLLAPLATSYMIAIAASLLVAVTITPVLCTLLLPGAVKRHHDRTPPVLAMAQAVYRPFLELSLRYTKTVVFVALGLFVAAVMFLLPMGRSFLPEFNEGSLNIAMQLPPGSTLKDSDALARQAEKALLKDRAVVSVGRRTGRAEKDEHVLGVESSEFEVRLAPDPTRTKREVFSDIRERLRVVPGARFEVGQPISHRIDHMLSGQRSMLSVKIFGDDLNQLRDVGREVQTIAQNIPGLVDVALEQMVDIPQLVLRVKREPAARYGLTAGDVAQQMSTALWGERVAEIYEDSLATDVVLIYGKSLRDQKDRIASMRLRTPTGANIEVQELAEVLSQEGPNYVLRENLQRRLVLQANLDSEDPTKVISSLRAQIDRSVRLPAGMSIRLDGQYERAKLVSTRLWVVSGIVFVGIILIIHSTVSSIRKSVIVLLNLPFALSGGAVGVYLAGSVLSVATMIGFITLFGIAVRNGILLVTRVGDLETQGVDPAQAVRQASMERLGPILMTALTAALGLLPLGLALGQPGSEIQAPMALVILTGLVSSTILNMSVVPAATLRWGDSPREASQETNSA